MDKNELTNGPHRSVILRAQKKKSFVDVHMTTYAIVSKHLFSWPD